MRLLGFVLLAPLLAGCSDFGYVARQSTPRSYARRPIESRESPYLSTVEYRHGDARHVCGYGCADYVHTVDVRGTGMHICPSTACCPERDSGPIWPSGGRSFTAPTLGLAGATTYERHERTVWIGGRPHYPYDWPYSYYGPWPVVVYGGKGRDRCDEPPPPCDPPTKPTRYRR